MWKLALLPFVVLAVHVMVEAMRPPRPRPQRRLVEDGLSPEEQEAHFDGLRRKRSDEIRAQRRPKS